MATDAEADSTPAVPGGAEADVEVQAATDAREAPAAEPVAEPVAEPAAAAHGQPPPEDVQEGWQPVKPKRRGRPPGSKNKPKILALPPEAAVGSCARAERAEVEEEQEPEPVRAPVRAAV